MEDSEYPKKELYLDGRLASRFYGFGDHRTWGEVEISWTEGAELMTLILDGAQYKGKAVFSINKHDTEIIEFTSE